MLCDLLQIYFNGHAIHRHETVVFSEVIRKVSAHIGCDR